MNPLRKKLAASAVLRTLSSVRIMVVGLSFLIILTFWGTIDQVYNGLYHAQEQFFHSFFFLGFGFLPFPGAQLVLWVMFVNLVCVAITRFAYRWSNLGILIIHFGLLLYFVSAFVTLHVVEESQLTLLEGQSANVSESYRDWELSVWKQNGIKKEVLAYDSNQFKTGQLLDFDAYGFNLIVKDYYPNADAYASDDKKAAAVLNMSGIQALQPAEPNRKEPEKNIPGGSFLIKSPQLVKDATIILYGGENTPTQIAVGKEVYYFMLRHKHFVLPLTVKLEDFMMEVHPDTNVARSYKSKVEIETKGLNREVIIFMNNPLRYKNYTFYQASYSIDELGRERSTLAVVKNTGRLLPYIACLITFAGLATHFLTMAFAHKRFKRA